VYILIGKGEKKKFQPELGKRASSQRKKEHASLKERRKKREGKLSLTAREGGRVCRNYLEREENFACKREERRLRYHSGGEGGGKGV